MSCSSLIWAGEEASTNQVLFVGFFFTLKTNKRSLVKPRNKFVEWQLFCQFARKKHEKCSCSKAILCWKYALERLHFLPYAFWALDSLLGRIFSKTSKLRDPDEGFEACTNGNIDEWTWGPLLYFASVLFISGSPFRTVMSGLLAGGHLLPILWGSCFRSSYMGVTQWVKHAGQLIT